jgi:hypothetical protein
LSEGRIGQWPCRAVDIGRKASRSRPDSLSTGDEAHPNVSDDRCDRNDVKWLDCQWEARVVIGDDGREYGRNLAEFEKYRGVAQRGVADPTIITPDLPIRTLCDYNQRVLNKAL